MRTGKGNQDDEEYGENKFGPKIEGPSSIAPSTTLNYNNSDSRKAPKISERVNVIRSKHSVTEQRRRSKINERFQVLRELIPHSEQKRDTASFLLEVIEYVQCLQEKVQKYEGSYPVWSPEATKLIPWRNSHWRVQSFASHPHAITNGSGPGTPFPGRFEENIVATASTMVTSTLNPVEPDPNKDMPCKLIDRQPELECKVLPLSVPLASNISASLCGAEPECAASSNALAQREDLIIEAGTISISSSYSQELLSSLTQSLERAGIDLSHAKISMQIDLGKQANPVSTSGTASSKNPSSGLPAPTQHPRATSGAEESNQAQKRLRI